MDFRKLLLLAAGLALLAYARQDLGRDQLALFQDASGWELLSITDANNGFETQHTCFDKAETGQCRGNLTFRRDRTFLQSVTVGSKSLNRHGSYELAGNSITFLDEFGTKDGPYSLDLNLDAKTLKIETRQAGVVVKMDLLLETEYRKRLQDQKKKSGK